MQRLFFLILFLPVVIVAQAQKLAFTTFAGFSNYQGELQPKRFTLNQAHLALGIGLTYEITEQLYATGSLKYGKISGTDAGTLNAKRNLKFSSLISELQLGLEYDFLNLNERSLTPYVFGGLAIFHFNPYAADSSGNKVYLQPLGTEGQGFYQGRKKYNLNQFAIPFGGGIKLALNDNIRIGFEIGLRKTFTDYLDDVSTTYVDRNLLLTNNGQRAVEFAFRGNQLKPSLAYPTDRSIRGNPKSKDWYYFSGLSVSFKLGSDEGDGHFTGKYQLGCPKKVF